MQSKCVKTKFKMHTHTHWHVIIVNKTLCIHIRHTSIHAIRSWMLTYLSYLFSSILVNCMILPLSLSLSRFGFSRSLLFFVSFHIFRFGWCVVCGDWKRMVRLAFKRPANMPRACIYSTKKQEEKHIPPSYMFVCSRFFNAHLINAIY